MAKNPRSDVDAVVIGSGAGGLAAALSLARAGQRVVVLEQHYVPGGWCHSFTLGGYRFSPGVHYVGELGPEGRLRAIYEGLGVAGDLAFFELDPEGYDQVVVGEKRFRYPKGKERLEARLCERWPHEAAGIRGYLDTIERLNAQLGVLMRARGPLDLLLAPARAGTVLRHGLCSLERLLDRHVSNPVLRAVLSAQAGDHGLPPSRAPAALHAGVQAHYFDGGYYPVGGGFAIPRAFQRALRRKGGEVRLRARVQRILVEGPPWRRRAVGVRLSDGTEVRAKWVISNADPAGTFRLLPPQDLGGRLRRRLDRTRYSVSVLSLFLAVDMDLRAAGLTSGNVWWTRTTDLDAHARHVERVRKGLVPLDHEPPGLFLTATTLKDPTKRPRHGARAGHHTLEAFCFYPYEPLLRWADLPSGERDAAYEALKEKLIAAMLKAVGRAIPGIEQHVVFADLGTPVTNEHYVAAHQGSIYGTEKTLRNLGPLAYQLRTPLPGLFHCGASTLSHGVVGATMSGIACARTVLGCRTRDLVNEEGQHLQVYQAEDPATWPDKLRAQAAALEAASA